LFRAPNIGPCKKFGLSKEEVGLSKKEVDDEPGSRNFHSDRTDTRT